MVVYARSHRTGSCHLRQPGLPAIIPSASPDGLLGSEGYVLDMHVPVRQMSLAWLERTAGGGGAT